MRAGKAGLIIRPMARRRRKGVHRNGKWPDQPRVQRCCSRPRDRGGAAPSLGLGQRRRSRACGSPTPSLGAPCRGGFQRIRPIAASGFWTSTGAPLIPNSERSAAASSLKSCTAGTPPKMDDSSVLTRPPMYVKSGPLREVGYPGQRNRLVRNSLREQRYRRQACRKRILKR
jgi:hypothetical protein